MEQTKENKIKEYEEHRQMKNKFDMWLFLHSRENVGTIKKEEINLGS